MREHDFDLFFGYSANIVSEIRMRRVDPRPVSAALARRLSAQAPCVDTQDVRAGALGEREQGARSESLLNGRMV